jgi:hypothetical protein
MKRFDTLHVVIHRLELQLAHFFFVAIDDFIDADGFGFSLYCDAVKKAKMELSARV